MLPDQPQDHTVSVRVGSQTIEKWSDYSVELDMLTAADGWHLTLGNPTREMFKLCAPDASIEVLLDETVVCSGFIDERNWSVDREGGAKLSINGRDKMGRLTDESAPLLSYNGLGIEQLALAIAAPWFTKVTLQNTRNRQLLRGKAAPKLKVAGEPIFSGRRGHRSDKKVNPGESRWHVLSSFLEEAHLLAWSSGDGKELIVGLPNYEQEPSFHFTVVKAGSERRSDGNMLSYARVDSVADRYSQIIACGAGKGSAANYSDRVTKRRGVASNGPGKSGIGKDFTYPKVLLVSDDDVRDEDQAQVRADREMAERDSTGHRLTIKMRGHSQRRTDGTEVLFAPDTVAFVEDEIAGLASLWLITGVTFNHNRQDGETSDLELVPVGTALRI